MLVADAYPNFSICGLPYYLSGDVTDWRDLVHGTATDLEQAPPTRSRLGCADWAAPSPDSHALYRAMITDARWHRTGHRLTAEQGRLPPPAAGHG